MQPEIERSRAPLGFCTSTRATHQLFAFFLSHTAPARAMTMPTSFVSPPPSPLLARFSSVSDSDRSSRRLSSMPLKMADVANILLKMRRHRARSQQQHVESSSGDWPITHPGLASDGTLSPCRVPLEQNDTFVCRDGVDVVKLLRLVRATLYEVAQSLGANVLVDEQYVDPSAYEYGRPVLIRLSS